MENKIREDFNNCHQLKDYEDFVIKYNHICPDHELIKEAKVKITSCAKEIDATKYWPLFVLAGLIAIGLSIFLIKLGLKMDGQPDKVTYHGEHGDYKVPNYNAALGFFGLFGGIALACAGIYGIVYGIRTAINRQNI